MPQPIAGTGDRQTQRLLKGERLYGGTASGRRSTPAWSSGRSGFRPATGGWMAARAHWGRWSLSPSSTGRASDGAGCPEFG
ncbi:MAG: hypothetical protein H0V43_12680 [Gemmatimonadales bacterium]|nr:hypothetical protein [Gemmatimonadales bacterium]